MKCPFPGMDPFLEDQRWSDFHHEFISSIRALLVPPLLPDYSVNVEQMISLLRSADSDDRLVVPDLSIEESGEWTGGPDGGTAVAVKPVTRTLPKPQTIKRPYLTVRSMTSREVVTVIELLSPWNKNPRGGRSEYLDKRDAYLQSSINVVELDLLRGGSRLPTVEPLPRGDYFAFVCRGTKRPKVSVYAWQMNHPLPRIPIPLAPGDADVKLELQAAFNETYQRAGYRYSLDYTADVVPKLRPAERVWVRRAIKASPKT
ncbi:MAG: DUF4058 family protein [Planctomycetaceae bacterium]